MPATWTRTTLGEVAEINPPRPKTGTMRDDTAVLFVPMAAVDDVTGTVARTDECRLADVREKSYRSFAPGDVLFAKITPCMENGKSAIVPPTASGLGFGSTEFHVLRARPGISPRFLWHFVRQQSFRQLARGQMTGSVGQLRVPASFLEHFPIEVPNLATQEKLTETLDATVEAARSAIRHTDASIRAVAHLRESILMAAASGRLTETWRATHACDPVSAPPRPSSAAAAHVSGAPNTDELTQIPDSWAWWPIEAVTKEVIDYRGRTPPSEPTGLIPHVRTSQIRNGRVDWTAVDRFVSQEVYDEYMTRGLPHRGDVLFTMEAPMGEVAVIDRDEPFSLAQRILLLRASDLVSARFFALALRSPSVRRAIEYRATGSGVLGIAYKRLRSVRVPVPPREEQDEIVESASRVLGNCEELERRIGIATVTVERTARSVVEKTFRGELGPNEASRPAEVSA